MQKSQCGNMRNTKLSQYNWSKSSLLLSDYNQRHWNSYNARQRIWNLNFDSNQWPQRRFKQANK